MQSKGLSRVFSNTTVQKHQFFGAQPSSPRTIQAIKFFRPEYSSAYPFPSPGDLPNPGIEPWSPALRADSLPSEPLGKPKDTGVGSLSLLQGIFLTQESNQGLLHCRQILYQLSYQGSPSLLGTGVKSKSLGPAHTAGEGISPGCESQGQGSLEPV